MDRREFGKTVVGGLACLAVTPTVNPLDNITLGEWHRVVLEYEKGTVSYWIKPQTKECLFKLIEIWSEYSVEEFRISEIGRTIEVDGLGEVLSIKVDEDVELVSLPRAVLPLNEYPIC